MTAVKREDDVLQPKDNNSPLSPSTIPLSLTSGKRALIVFNHLTVLFLSTLGAPCVPSKAKVVV